MVAFNVFNKVSLSLIPPFKCRNVQSEKWNMQFHTINDMFYIVLCFDRHYKENVPKRIFKNCFIKIADMQKNNFKWRKKSKIFSEETTKKTYVMLKK